MSDVQEILDEATNSVVSSLEAKSFLQPAEEKFNGLLEAVDSAVKPLLVELKRRFDVGDENDLAKGGIIDTLNVDFGCKQSWIAEKVKRSEATISGLLTLYRASKSVNYDGMAPETLVNVVRASKRVEQRVARSHPEIGHKVDLQNSVNLVSAMLTAGEPTRMNDIIVALVTDAKATIAPQIKQAAVAVAAKITGGLLNQCHHCDYRDLIEQIAPGSVHLLHADPPYASYKHGAGAGHSMAGLTECDHDTNEAAIEVTCALFPAAQKLLTRDGVLVLWQAASALRWQIAKAAEDAGFTDLCFVWDKGRPQPGWPESAFSQRCEIAYIYTRKDERAINYDSSDRDNIRYYKPVQHNRAEINPTHAYEKPAELMEMLVGKLTPPGGVVADFCGCSGSLSVAAHKLGRRFIYVESNKANFDFGSARIAAQTAQPTNDDGAEDVTVAETPAEMGVIAA